MIKERAKIAGQFEIRNLRRAVYAPILAPSMAIMFARMLVMARLLEVAEFAAFSAILLISTIVTMLGCLGLFLKLQRDLPMFHVRGQRRAAAVIFGQALTGAAALAGLGWFVAATGVAVSGIRGAALATAVLHGLSQQTFLIVTSDSRSRGRPLQYAWQNLVRAVLVVACQVPVALATGSAVAVLLIEAAVTIAVSVAILREVLSGLGRSLRTTLSLGVLMLPRENFVTLFHLVMVSVIGFLSTNLDRWLAAELLPTERFSLYAFAWTLMIIAMSVQALINASLFPTTARHYATDGLAAAFRVCAVASLGALAACAIAVVPGVYVLRLAIDAFFPKYVDAKVLIPVLSVAAAVRLADYWSGFLVIVGRERWWLAWSTTSVLASLAVWFALVRSPTALDCAWLALGGAVLNVGGLGVSSWYFVRQAPAKCGA